MLLAPLVPVGGRALASGLPRWRSPAALCPAHTRHTSSAASSRTCKAPRARDLVLASLSPPGPADPATVTPAPELNAALWLPPASCLHPRFQRTWLRPESRCHGRPCQSCAGPLVLYAEGPPAPLHGGVANLEGIVTAVKEGPPGPVGTLVFRLPQGSRPQYPVGQVGVPQQLPCRPSSPGLPVWPTARGPSKRGWASTLPHPPRPCPKAFVAAFRRGGFSRLCGDCDAKAAPL